MKQAIEEWEGRWRVMMRNRKTFAVCQTAMMSKEAAHELATLGDVHEPDWKHWPAPVLYPPYVAPRFVWPECRA